MSDQKDSTSQERSQPYRPVLLPGEEEFQNPLVEVKSWNKSLESEIFVSWEKEGLLGKFDVNSSKPIFVMDTPPPYPSGRPWHARPPHGPSR